MIRDNFVFIQEFLREFQATGTIWPTSKWAAKTLITPLLQRASRTPLKVLELGPGTGSVTTHILKHLRTDDQMTVCEINPRFMKVLQENLRDNEDFQLHKERVSFYECPVQELPENEKYDVIVCAIPFLNLDLATVEEIFTKLRRISRPDTIMTFYEYIGLRSLSMVVSPPKRRDRIKQIDGFFERVFQHHLARRYKVYLNLLPINVYMLKELDSIPVAA